MAAVALPPLSQYANVNTKPRRASGFTLTKKTQQQHQGVAGRRSVVIMASPSSQCRYILYTIHLCFYQCLTRKNISLSLSLSLTGLQRASLDSDTAFSIDNDCPLFAAPYKKMLDQLSFSLRKKHGASDKLRTKIILSNLKLKIKLRDSSAKDKRDWFSPEDDRAAKYFDNTRVLYKADNTPATIPTCREFYKQILDMQAE